MAALAALISDLNPFLTLRDKLTLIKQTARRQGGWSPELGWGIIDAGAAVDAARRIDRRAPARRRGRRSGCACRARRRIRCACAGWAPIPAAAPG